MTTIQDTRAFTGRWLMSLSAAASNREVMMPEMEHQVRTFRIKYVCDQCAEGEMKSGHGISNSFGTDWYHKCDKCGHEQWFETCYPRIVTRAL